MTSIHIELLNHNELRVRADRDVLMEISDRFTHFAPNFRFMPSYKSGYWDGKIRFFNANNGTFPAGLLPDVLEFCSESSFTTTFCDRLRDIMRQVREYDTNDVDSFISTLSISDGSGNAISPHDYQIEAVHESIRNKRRVIKSATGSGKSLMIYMICRYLETKGKKILLIVPTVSLVNQMFSDFQEYSTINQWDVLSAAHRIYSGQEKKVAKVITISTWQSLMRQPKEWFIEFDVVIGDECHQVKATEISKVFQKCVRAEYRLGFTGTLSESITDNMTIFGVIGQPKSISSSKQLIDKKILADLQVIPVLIKHDSTSCSLVKGKPYQEEMDFLATDEKRNRLICKTALSLKGNTIVVVQYIEKHAKPLFQMLKKMNTNKKIWLITGGTEPEERERLRKLCNETSDNIMVVSYGVFSTGVNIVNLNNAILASPSKAKIRVLQTVGRTLRRSKEKTSAILIDYGDDLSGGKKSKNTTMKHFVERIRYYAEEGYHFSVKTLNL